MNPIPAEYIPLFADRIRILGELTISAENAHELFHGYQQYLSMKMTLEQISRGDASNVDFSKWAARVISEEKRTRPKLKFPNRLVKIEVA
jgi:hypothetical protein